MRNDNWNQLCQAFARERVPVSQALIDEVIKRKAGSAIKMIEVLYSWFTHRTILQAKIGDFNNKSKEAVTQVSSIEPPPPVAKPVVEEAPKEAPIIAPLPKRARFIGAPQAPRDQEAIAFQPASVVKTGPGFLQLRNQTTGNQIIQDDNELAQYASDLLSSQTPENIEGFLSLLNNTSNLIKFLQDLPTLNVIKLILIVKKDLNPQIHLAILQSLSQYFIPSIDFTSVPINELADFFYQVFSPDPFTHHFILNQVIELAPKELHPEILLQFLSRETSLIPALSKFYINQIRALVPHPSITACLPYYFHLDFQSALTLLADFPPTFNPEEDLKLVDAYSKAPMECVNHIELLIEKSSSSLSCYLLTRLLENKELPTRFIVNLILKRSNLDELLVSSYEITVGSKTTVVGPLIPLLNAFEVVQSIVEDVEENKPDGLDKEIVLISLVIPSSVNQSDNWLKLFTSLHEYLYLGLCDEKICQASASTILAFFKILQNEVFNTFSSFFKALNFVYPTDCPAACKSNSTQLLTDAADISGSFAQTVLKLLMNFPPKTHPDLDKLLANLKKVRR